MPIFFKSCGLCRFDCHGTLCDVVGDDPYRVSSFLPFPNKHRFLPSLNWGSAYSFEKYVISIYFFRSHWHFTYGTMQSLTFYFYVVCTVHHIAVCRRTNKMYNFLQIIFIFFALLYMFRTYYLSIIRSTI